MVIPEIPAWLSYEAQKLAYSRPSGSVFWTSKRRLEHRISTTYVPHDLKYIHLVTSDHLKFSRPPWKVMLPATTLSASTPSPEGPGASSPGLSLIFLNQGSGFRADVCSCSPHPTTQDSFWSLWLAQLFLLGMLVALPEMHPTPPHPWPSSLHSWLLIVHTSARISFLSKAWTSHTLYRKFPSDYHFSTVPFTGNTLNMQLYISFALK